MNQILLFVGIVAATVAFVFIRKTLMGKKVTLFKKTFDAGDFFIKALAVLLFVLYIPHLFSEEYIDDQIGLTIDEVARQAKLAVPGGVYHHLPFSQVGTILLLALKWMTSLTIAVLIVSPFFEKREGRDYMAFIAPIVLVLNCVFFKEITMSIVWDEAKGVQWYYWQVIVYACVIALAGGISGERLVRYFAEKDWRGMGKRVGKLVLFILFYLLAFMPIYAPQLLFGLVGDEANSFTPIHRIFLYITALFPFTVYFLCRNKSYEEKRYMLILLALSGFVQYFDLERSGINGLPLHLCNTAIALMFITYVFNLKGVFYFTYLVNVLGAIFALLMPNTESVWTSMDTMVFYYNHIYAVVLPILGVQLGVFERPTMKLMKKAIIAFTCYVLFAATMDAWLNNSASLNVVDAVTGIGMYGAENHIDIDYFFLYSDFFINKASFAVPIKYNFIWRFRIGDTVMTYFWLYDIVVYVIFVALMFVIWGVYGIMYKVEDKHKELLRRKRLMRVDKVNLLKEMDGRPMKEPLHPEGAKMIKIEHFSKTYAGSNKKSVDDLNLEIYEGEVFGFIGHNGAGKSTTIKSMVGIQTITEGRIEIQGYDIARQPLEAKLNIGYVSDNHAVYEKLTGREYVGYVADLYLVSKKDKEERIEKYAKMFGLEEAMDREIKSYSHGMKQKLMMISALIHNPKVWVLDEPLTGLDPTSSIQIKECMKEHAKAGNIVFFSSHVIEVVEKICDRVAIISGGKLCRVCTQKELEAEGHSLEELYKRYAIEGAGAKFDDKAEVAATVVASGDNND